MCLSYSYYFDTVSCKILKTYRPSFPLWKSKKPFTGIWLPGNCLPSPLLGSNCPWAQLFSFAFLRCHNGGEPDVDKGEMGVIKSEPRAARHRCHTYGVVMSLRHCRRVLFFFPPIKECCWWDNRNATSWTLTAWHPQIAAIRTANQVRSCRKASVSAPGRQLRRVECKKKKNRCLFFKK